jgi:hypothetical protein
VVIFSLLTLFWQLVILSVCCSGLGLALRSLLPPDFSPLNKVLFSFIGGLFLVVLLAQNLVYLNIPVRISAWLLLSAALLPGWWSRHKFAAWSRRIYSDADFRTLAVVVLLTVIFHGLVPIRQGLEWYYGKGHFDQMNYVMLAEFLKEEPYRTSELEIGLRPWLVGPVGFKDNQEQTGTSLGTRQQMIGLKKERIGQSIINAEISAWSGTDAQAGYGATVIFFLTVLAICLYAFLRESGIDCFTGGAGALLGVLLPAITRLSLNGFLSQVSILFVFPFFASLLRRQELGAKSFTLFFSLSLAYLIAAYSEIAPIGFCTFILGAWWVRRDSFRSKRLILMSGILLIALVNPYYVRNLIEFLEFQYNLAANAGSFWDNAAPNILSLRGWTELLFGVITSWSFTIFFDCCTLLLALLFVTGAIFLSRREGLILAAIAVPAIFVLSYLATRTPFSYYPIAKIMLTFLPTMIGLVFVTLSRVTAGNQARLPGVVMKVFSAMIVAATAAGSVRYYIEVLQNEGTLQYVREPRFLNVCRALEEMKNKRIFLFENDPLLTGWLSYRARHNEVYVDLHLTSDSHFLRLAPFSKTPNFATIDFAVSPYQIVNLRNPAVSK